MTNDIWLNLPVKDLAKSIHFFTQIGFQHNPGPGNTAHSASFLVGDKAAVGTVFAEPGESNGFMYGCGFCDPDGHRWNPVFMDLSKLPK